MNGIPKTYKLISTHGGIEAPCMTSWGDAIFKVPHNICIVFLSDYGSAITTKLPVNHPNKNEHYGFYTNIKLIESYFKNPLGSNIPQIFKNANILIYPDSFQDMSLTMPPNPKYIDQTKKRFPQSDYEKGIYNLPLDIKRIKKLKNAHTSHENGAKNISRFDILNDLYRNYNNPYGITIKLHQYVFELSNRGGGYIFVDACRVVKAHGNSRYTYGNFTLFRTGLNTLEQPYGRTVRVRNNNLLKQRAKNEANASKKYKQKRVDPRDLITPHRGFRNLRSIKKRKNHLGENVTKQIVNAYSGTKAPSSIERDRLLWSLGLPPSRYRI